MKKYFLIMLIALSSGLITDSASARVHVVVSHGYAVAENVIVEDYPQYYVDHRIPRQSRHRCHHCRSRSHHRIRYYHPPVYYAPGYYYHAPQREVVVYEQIYYWGW